MHDLLLDFARDRIRPARLELAASCQARYLGRLDVVRRYADEGENKEGLHSLVAFWRSVRELSGTAPTEVEGYLANLREVAEEETSDAFWVHWALGSFFELQVGVGRVVGRFVLENVVGKVQCRSSCSVPYYRTVWYAVMG